MQCSTISPYATPPPSITISQAMPLLESEVPFTPTPWPSTEPLRKSRKVFKVGVIMMTSERRLHGALYCSAVTAIAASPIRLLLTSLLSQYCPDNTSNLSCICLSQYYQSDLSLLSCLLVLFSSLLFSVLRGPAQAERDPPAVPRAVPAVHTNRHHPEGSSDSSCGTLPARGAAQEERSVAVAVAIALMTRPLIDFAQPFLTDTDTAFILTCHCLCSCSS